MNSPEDQIKESRGFDFLSEVEAGHFRRFQSGPDFGLCTADGKDVAFPIGRDLAPYDRCRCGWPATSPLGINFIYPLELAEEANKRRDLQTHRLAVQ